MKIEKRVQSRYFKAVLEGRKQFEVRVANFRSKPGDTLILLEQQNNSRKLTGRKLTLEVLYKFNTKSILKFYSKADIDKYGLVILAIRRKYKYK